MSDELSEKIRASMTHLQTDALLGGSPEGMMDRIKEIHGVDLTVVDEQIEKTAKDIIDWMGASDTYHERVLEECDNNPLAIMAQMGKTVAHLVGMRMFMAGYFVGKDEKIDESVREEH